MPTAKARSNKTSTLSADPWLKPFLPFIERRAAMTANMERRLTGGKCSLSDFANAHEYFGLHFRDDAWVFREWAPNATAIYLVGDFSGWQEQHAYSLKRLNPHGEWELKIPADILKHGMHYRLSMHWPGGSGERIPVYARYVVQD
ncbi:MAG: hypothetical protein PHV59_05445, partial [Victivallales bacterium]|nr:hypothetical protein [Victivallales bacterium]